MSLHARVQGFISLTLAEIDIDKIALLVGHNAAGKSALVDGLACALTGQHGARDVTAKKDMKTLLHDGYREADANIWDDAGNSSSMRWPLAQHVTTGKGITLDPISAGLAKLTDAKPAERIELIWNITRSQITHDDVRQALAKAKIPDGAIEQVITRIDKDMMDGALAYYKEKRIKQKGAWEAATRETYGSSKAAGWAPEGWTPDLDKATEAGLRTALDEASAAWEQAVGEGAVSQERRGALEHAAAGLDKHQAAYDLAERDVAAYRKQLDELAEQRAKLPALAPGGQVRCPKCKAPLKVETSPGATKISLGDEAEDIDEAELKRIRLDIAGLDGSLSRLRGNVSTAETLMATAKGNLDRATKARDELDGLTKVETSGEDLTATSEALSRAKERLDLWRSKAAADLAQRQIAGLEILIEVLGPNGVKLIKTKAALDTINTELAAMCTAADGFPAVTIDDDLVIRAGGRPYGLLSTGYQFFASAVIQLALARLQGAALVLIDGAEVLTGDNRAALLKMVARSGVPAVLAMAVKRETDVPDLAKMKLGMTYWVEEGQVRPVSE